MTAAVTEDQGGRRIDWRRGADATGCRMSTCCPAFLIMGAHHALPADLPGLDVVHELRDPEPAHRLRGTRVGRRQELRRRHHQPAEHPELRVRPAAALQPGLGVRQRRRSTSSSAWGSRLLVHTKGLWFKRFYRSLFILPVVIPPIIVATVWKNMFDADNGAINQLLAGVGGLVRPARQPVRCRLAPAGRGPDLVHPAAARVLRDVDHEHVAGLAAQRGRRHGRPPEHPERAVRGGRDRWRQSLAAVQERDAGRSFGRPWCRMRSTAS